MICKHCNNPIIMHVEARYTIEDSDDMEYGMHYKCHEARLSKLKPTVIGSPAKMPEIKKTLDDIRSFFK